MKELLKVVKTLKIKDKILIIEGPTPSFSVCDKISETIKNLGGLGILFLGDRVKYKITSNDIDKVMGRLEELKRKLK